MLKEKVQPPTNEQNPSGFKLLHSLPIGPAVINEIAWSPNGLILAWSCDDSSIHLFHFENNKSIRVLNAKAGYVITIAWSPDGMVLASGSADGLIHLWNVKSNKPVRIMKGHSGAIYSVAWSPDGKILASGSADDRIRLWSMMTYKPFKTFSGHRGDIIQSLAWSPDGKFLASGSADGFLYLWDITNNKSEKVNRIDGGIWDLEWSPDGQNLALCAGDNTIRLFETQNKRDVSILEGHTDEPLCIRFSSDGRFLVSQSADATIRLWSTKNWETIGILNEATNGVLGGLAIHPNSSFLATRGEIDHSIHIWEMDRTILFSGSPAIESVRYMTAKIVLLGDAGVGKTGLGWRLAHGHFKDHPSTHGQQFWILTMLSNRFGRTDCEAVLWDLAGQPDYRLIHAIFLDDAQLALVLFNPCDRQDPLHGVDYWLKALSRKNTPPCRTILVGARMDRGSPTLTLDEINTFCRDRGISAGFINTSALTGEGIEDLLTLMKGNIVWESMAATVTTTTFKRIKQYVLSLKEISTLQSILFSMAELRTQLQETDANWKFSDQEMMTAVGHLAKHGYVQVLRTAGGEKRTLLKPELLNNLAASFIIEARRNPKGLGALDEERVLRGQYNFPELVGLSIPEREILLDSATILFLEHNICFRESLGPLTFLIFPELINLRRKPLADESEHIEDVSYKVVGSVENVYASLVVLLGYTNTFTRTEQWRDQAQYEMTDGGVCGFKRISEQDGEIDFVLYYDVNIEPPDRLLFQGLFERFLINQDVTVTKYPPLHCSKCNYKQERSEAIRRTNEGKGFIHCSECGNKLSIGKPGQIITFPLKGRQILEQEQAEASRRTEFEMALVWLKSYLLDRNNAEKPPSCFVSYAWGNLAHERWVEKRLCTDLRNAGIEVILDRWHNAAIGSNVPRFISRIAESDMIIVVGIPLYREKYENIYDAGSTVAAEVDLINHRLTGTEAEKMTVLPALLAGDKEKSFPPLLWDRVYADFTRESSYFEKLFTLILTIYKIPFDQPAVADLQQMLHERSQAPGKLVGKAKRKKLSRPPSFISMHVQGDEGLEDGVTP